NCLRIPFLRALFPDARFVFLRRDGRATISSLIEGWRAGSRYETYRLPAPLPIAGTKGRAGASSCRPAGVTWRRHPSKGSAGDDSQRNRLARYRLVITPHGAMALDHDSAPPGIVGLAVARGAGHSGGAMARRLNLEAGEGRPSPLGKEVTVNE